MRGHQIPTSVKTTMCMSPFSAVGAIGSGGLALLSCKYDKCGKLIPCSSPFGSIKNKLSGLIGKGGSSNGLCCGSLINCCKTGLCTSSCGNLIICKNDHSGCFSPCYETCINPCFCGSGICPCAGWSAKKGGLITRARGGAIGCKSLMMRGALPVRR